VCSLHIKLPSTRNKYRVDLGDRDTRTSSRRPHHGGRKAGRRAAGRVGEGPPRGREDRRHHEGRRAGRRDGRRRSRQEVRRGAMANFTMADVKKLREATGSGMMDVKKALEEADGDYDAALEALRIKGAKDVGKRAERTTAQGLVAQSGNTLLELLCETDFVAKSGSF